MLTVSARRAEERGEDERTIARERIMGTFTRRLYLGDTLDSDKVEATYANGVLVVRVPVAEKARPRKIEIQNDTTKKITA